MRITFNLCAQNRINDKMINGFWYFLSFSVLIYINDMAKPLWFPEYQTQCSHIQREKETYTLLYKNGPFLLWREFNEKPAYF